MKNDIEERKNKIKSMIENLINDGKFKDAKGLLDDYVKSIKDDAEAYSMLSVVLCALGEYDKAENAVMQGIMLDRYNFDLNYNLAEIYFNKENYELALVYYRISYQNTEDVNTKDMIKGITKDIFIKLGIDKDITEYLCENINLTKDNSCLILCHFNSVYTQEFFKNIKAKTGYSLDVLSMDNGYRDTNKSLVNQVYCYKDMYELRDALNKINKYEIIHIHFLTPFYGDVAELIRSKCDKLIITIWGSDFLRSTQEHKNMQRKLIETSDIITFDNEFVLNDFADYFGGYCREKSVICRFGLTALEYLNNLGNVDKNEIRDELKVPKNDIVVTCGYNANMEQNHLGIIKSIKQIKDKLPSNLYFIFPMTYSWDEQYVKNVKKQLKNSGLKYKVLYDFMSLEQNAKYTIISDIMIQVQTTDTLSASMQEQMYCGNIIITGSWLPYKSLKENRIYFLETDSVDKIGEKLIETVNNINKIKNKCKINTQLIWDYSAWENTIEDWKRIYIEPVSNKNKINKRKKVLVLAYFFPPIGGAGVQRTLKYVKYLRDFGWEPVVVTAGKSDYFAKDESLLKEIPEEIEIIRIDDFVDEKLSTQFLNGLIQIYSRIVNDNELISEFINKVNSNDENFNKYIFTPDVYVAWAYKVINCIEKLIDFDNIDLVYSTSSPYSDHLIGYFIKKKFNKPWVADFRDEWTNNPFADYDKNDLKFKIERRMEEAVVNSADAITTISDISVQNYINIFNLLSFKVKCITNGYDEADFKDIDIYKLKTHKFRIIHNGFLYGESRYPINLFAALLDLINKGIIDQNKIEVYFTRSENDVYLKSLIDRYHLQQIVKCTGYLEHKESLMFTSKMNCCLLIIGNEEKSKSVYTGKVFEYLRTGKPILSLAPLDGLVDKLLKETGRGINCDIQDIEKIEKVIGDLYNKWRNNNEETYDSNDKIAKYERKNLTRQLVDVFEMGIKKNKSALNIRKRLLFVTYTGGDTFLSDIISVLSEKYEIRKINIDTNDDLIKLESNVEWADICWFEWCNGIIAYASNLQITKTKKVICRLHRFEAFTNNINNIKWANIDKVIFVSEYIRDVVIENSDLTFEKCVVIPNGINTNKFKLVSRHKGFNIACIAYLDLRKNPMFIIQCFNELYKIDNRYNLYFAGNIEDVSLRDYLYGIINRLGIQNNIHFDGKIPNDKINSWLEDKNYIVSGSISEGHPVGVMEAMATGLKPIFHYFPGVLSFYPDRYIFNDVSSFIKLIKESYYDCKEYSDYIKNKFSLEIQMDKINNLFNELLNITVEYSEEASYDISHLPANIDKDESEVEEYYNDFLDYLKKDREEHINARHTYLKNRFSTIIKPQDSVLDLGCGIGITTEFIKKMGVKKVIGVDLSPKLIEYAKKTVEDINFIVHDITNLDLHEKFDVITLCDVMEHVPQDKYYDLFHVIKKHLKKEGIVYISIPDPKYQEFTKVYRKEDLQIIDNTITFADIDKFCNQNNMNIIFYNSYGIWESNQYNEYTIYNNRLENQWEHLKTE